MDISHVRPGMIVEYHQDAVEVISIDASSQLALVRRQSDSRHFTAQCRELFEDPQLHTDCPLYY